jgi:hypothetical protein
MYFALDCYEGGFIYNQEVTPIDGWIMLCREHMFLNTKLLLRYVT